MPYRHIELPKNPSPADLLSAADDYEAIAITMMEAILDRYDRSPDYPFIDTKLDLITGRDFPEDDPIRGRDAIYGWIQGRGLEALAGHARWLSRVGGHDRLVHRIHGILREILDQLRQMRDRNSGHLSFLMRSDGSPFELDDDSHPIPFTIDAFGFSDLFAAKGMYSAADLLDDGRARTEAIGYITGVDDAIRNRTFRSDQISLDPTNRTEPRSGYHPHGATMIQIGAWVLLAGHDHPNAIERGLWHIEYELDTHANLEGRWDQLMEGDFWEAVDDAGHPYVEPDGVILSDPGHSLEFVGLAMKFIQTVQHKTALTSGHQDRLSRAKRQMVKILSRNFDNGYIPGPKGISKAFDLAGRCHLNTDMPWWNLPETIRAATLCLDSATGEQERSTCLSIIQSCHNAFREFTRPDLHLMAYQTRDAEGQPVSVIPATADADPGYHTGLSLLDAIDAIRTR